MKKTEIQKIANEVQAEIEKGKATFFINPKEKPQIPCAEQLYELKADISDRVSLYFYELLKKDEK